MMTQTALDLGTNLPNPRSIQETYFLAERRMPGLTVTDRHAVQRALHQASRRVTAEGTPVRYLRSGYVPGEERWLCLFASALPDAVRRVFEIAQVPNASVVEVVEVGDALGAGDLLDARPVAPLAPERW
jgi:hypothetical protein